MEIHNAQDGTVSAGHLFVAVLGASNRTYLRERAHKDIGGLLEWIKTRSDLDADRIMVTSGSYGGLYSDRERAALDYAEASPQRADVEWPLRLCHSRCAGVGWRAV